MPKIIAPSRRENKLQPRTCLTPHSWWTPCNINVIYTPLKSAFNELQFRRWQYGYIFIRLAVIDSETWEMSRNSKRIWPYSSSRSSKIIDFGVNGKPICDVLLVVNCNVSLSATVFEIFTLRDRKLKDRKLLILPPFPCFTHQLGVTPFEFCDEIGNQKTRIVGLPDGEEIMTFLRLTQYRRVRDRQTDRRVAVTKTRASITSRGQKSQHSNLNGPYKRGKHNGYSKQLDGMERYHWHWIISIHCGA